MGQRFQRNLGNAANLTPGQFCVDYVRHPPGQAVAISICCPRCGGIDRIDQGPNDYTIERGGRMTPAWSCPWATCSYLEFVELSGFGEPQ